MTPGLFSRISITWITPPMLVLPVIVVAAVLITLDYRTSRRSVDELADDNMQRIHQNIEEHLSRLMEMPPEINALSRRMLDSGQLSLTDMERNREPVFQTLSIFQEVSSFVIGSADGPAMWVIRYPGQKNYEYAIKRDAASHMEELSLGDDGRPSSEKLGDFAFQPTDRPWYRAAVQAGGPTWGNVYIWVRRGKGETLGVSYVEPVRSAAGQILGVVNTELTLADISAYLGQLRVGKTGRCFIMERDGELIANSVGLSCMTADLKRVSAGSLSDPWIAPAARTLRQNVGKFDSANKTVSTSITAGKEPIRVVASPYVNRNLNWLIVTLAPDSDFLGDIQANRDRSIWLGLGIVAAMLLVSIAMVLAMISPILKLVSHLKKVEEGKLGERLELHDCKEMMQLSHAINDMVEGLTDRLHLRQALDVAMDVQQSLLPGNTPAIPGVDVAAYSKYCDQTGGDYYDYLDVAGVGENTLVVALGDVMGHGVAAAMLMATARGMLRSRVRVPGSLGELLTHVNELLVTDTKGTRFMTMVVAVIDANNGTLRWSSAGHDPPFIYDLATDAFFDMETPTGLPLGVEAGQRYEESPAIPLQAGEVIVIGTDGIWEARNPQNEEFGKERLKRIIRTAADRPAREIQKEISEQLKLYCGSHNIEDDVTYVVIKLTEKLAPRRVPVAAGASADSP